MLFRIATVFFAGMLLLSCSNSSHCYESADTLMITEFLGSTAVNMDSILIKGYQRNAAGDTLAFSKTASLTARMGLPLSLSADSTGFVIQANKKSGIIWIKHTMDIQLISKSCGFAPYYKLVAARYSSLIDSIRVYDLAVDPKSNETYSTNGQNIKVYLHLSTP